MCCVYSIFKEDKKVKMPNERDVESWKEKNIDQQASHRYIAYKYISYDFWKLLSTFSYYHVRLYVRQVKRQKMYKELFTRVVYIDVGFIRQFFSLKKKTRKLYSNLGRYRHTLMDYNPS